MTVAEQLEKQLIVSRIVKDRLGGCPTIHHMIHGARVNNTERTGHAPTIAILPKACNNRLDP